jgi:HEAT repeat protein
MIARGAGMGFRLEGNSPGVDLYNFGQDVRESCATFQEQLKAMIEEKLGHSIAGLQNRPELLRELLEDRDASKRAFAVIFLSKFDQNLADYEQILTRKAVRDPAPDVRFHAIVALGELGSYRHRDEIVRLLHGIFVDEDEVASVRKSAYLALAMIYKPTSMEFISELIESMLDPPGNAAAFVDEHINDDWIRELTEPE